MVFCVFACMYVCSTCTHGAHRGWKSFEWSADIWVLEFELGSSKEQ